QRRRVPPAVDRRNVKGITQAIEGQRARKRNGVPAIDKTSTESPAAFGELVEMDARGVLIEARRDLVFGFFDGHPVNVVDFFTNLVVAEAMHAPRQHIVIGRGIDAWTSRA